MFYIIAFFFKKVNRKMSILIFCLKAAVLGHIKQGVEQLQIAYALQ